jgi:hypothetical protein
MQKLSILYKPRPSILTEETVMKRGQNNTVAI